MKKMTNNPWDDSIVPALELNEKVVNYAYARCVNTQKVIHSLSIPSRKIASDLNVMVRRARQLAYIEPWFQTFLPPNLKGHLFIYSIGKFYWVVGAKNSMYANRFKYCQLEIQRSLESHLNKISTKQWKVPDLKVQTVPEDVHETVRFEHYLLEKKRKKLDELNALMTDVKEIKPYTANQKLNCLLTRLDQRIDWLRQGKDADE